MKKKYLGVTIVVSATIMIACVANIVSAGIADPGSESDPIVTASYVDTKINQLSDTISKLSAKVNSMPIGGGSSSGNTTSAEKYVAIKVEANKKVVFGEGAEFILRSGNCEITIAGANGISDVTSGKDLLNGAKVEPNHLMLVPRDDGRGILAKQESYMMIKGTYTIQ